MRRRIKMETKALLISLVITIPIIIYLTTKFGFSIELLAYSLSAFFLLDLFPYFLVRFIRYRKIKAMEERFPDFLRDIAESKKAGMTLPQAISHAAETNYGPLTEEIKKIKYQLSWGVPFPEAIKRFMERVSDSPLMNRGLAILLQAYYSGGNIAKTLESVADDSEILRNIEKERDTQMQEQVFVIYAIQLIFIGIVIALYKILIPMFSIQNLGEFSTFSGSATSFDPYYYKTLFFLTLSIQSIFNGLVAGQVKEGSVISGFKHSSIMLVSALIGYILFIYPETITFNIDVSQINLREGESFQLMGSLYLETEPVYGAEIDIYFGPRFFITSTDKNGEFSIKLIAPEEKGEHKIRVVAKFRGKQIEKSIKIRVS